MADCQFEIIVIGAGIAGVSVAAELARSGKTLLLERESLPGYHATGRSAAYFAPSYGNEVIRCLSAASESFFRTPPPDFTDVTLLQPRDAMFIARKDQAASVSAMLEEQGGVLQAVSGTTLRTRVPILAPDYVANGVLDTNGGDLDVDALVQGFLRVLRRMGGSITTSAGVDALEYGNGCWTVSTGSSVFRSPIVVNAAGAWADNLATLAGIAPLQLIPKRRTALLIETDEDCIHWPLVIDIDEMFYFKPEAGALLLSPADETPSPPCDAAPEELDIAIAVDRFEQATEQRVRRVRHKWAGLRTFAADKTPAVGYDPRTAGFFWLAGQGGYGVQTAPAMAELAAALILERTPPEDTAACVDRLQPARLLAAAT